MFLLNAKWSRSRRLRGAGGGSKSDIEGECNAEGEGPTQRREGRKVLLAEQLGKAEMGKVWRYILPLSDISKI